MNKHAERNVKPKVAPLTQAKVKQEVFANSLLQFTDNRPETNVQRKMQAFVNNGAQDKQAAQLQSMVSENSSLQSFLQKKENNTGLPHDLKSGIENLSGYSLDDVKVHYNSGKPAQLQAHAFAQGTDIHLASGQEKHLPHEVWHVVQQKQGRVRPTLQMKGGVNLNDDEALEREADVMGEKSLGMKIDLLAENGKTSPLKKNISQLRSNLVTQRVYAWSEEGEDGVLIGKDEPIVIKLGGFDSSAVALDQLGVKFGFTGANARIVNEGDKDWDLVKRAVKEAGGWSKEPDGEEKKQALIMDKIAGEPLYETSESLSVDDPKNPTQEERKKIERMCHDLGKMLVMDLVTRNNDRFNLVDFDDELQSTPAEKLEDESGWRRWMANEGNLLIDEDTGSANPIDSQFTPAENEVQYAENIAHLLVDRKDDLVASGMKILDHNWSNQDYAKKAFKSGITRGIEILLTLDD